MQRRPTNAYHPRRVRGVIVVHRARSVSGFRYRYTRAYDIRSAGQMHRTIMRSLAYLRVTDVPELGLYRKHTIEKAPLAYPIRKTTSRIPKAGGLMNRTPAEGSTCLRCPLSRWGTCSPPPLPPTSDYSRTCRRRGVAYGLMPDPYYLCFTMPIITYRPARAPTPRITLPVERRPTGESPLSQYRSSFRAEKGEQRHRRIPADAAGEEPKS